MSNITNPTTSDEIDHSQLQGVPVALADLNAPFSLASISDMDASGSDLTDGATVVYDASAGHIPASQVDPTIDADTLDGYDTPLPDAAVDGLPASGSGAWTEDANSPFTASGDASLGGSFADTYDLYKLVMHDVRGSSGSDEHLELTFNGATQYYGYVTVGGSTVNGASAFRVVSNRTPNAGSSASGYLFTTGRFSNQQQFRNLATQFLKGGATDSGACNAVSSPVGSFDLSWTNGSITGKVRVYGADV